MCIQELYSDILFKISEGQKLKFIKHTSLWILFQVKRYSYTTSNENSTSVQRMWSIERNCTNKCEPGCITIGERTKLYACTSCCDTSFCNTDRGGSEDTRSKLHITVLGPSLFLTVFLMK